MKKKAIAEELAYPPGLEEMAREVAELKAARDYYNRAYEAARARLPELEESLRLPGVVNIYKKTITSCDHEEARRQLIQAVRTGKMQPEVALRMASTFSPSALADYPRIHAKCCTQRPQIQVQVSDELQRQVEGRLAQPMVKMIGRR
jgi:hypothetical protein